MKATSLATGLLVAVLVPALAGADCSLTSTGRIPLPDLGLGTYQGFEGGLYPFGADNPPPAHEAAALVRGREEIKPRNAAGAVDLVNGKIVLLSVGMSNTSQEFSQWVNQLGADPAKNPQLVLVNGAQGGHDIKDWINTPTDEWDVVGQRLAAAGVTAAQVQAVWIKHAHRGSTQYGAFPVHAQTLRDDLGQLVRDVLAHLPNARIAYLSSRTRAYTNDPSVGSPEPYAYEGAFAVKWLIEQQIDGQGNLNFDPAAGSVVAPLLLWGPYLWADGTTPRSDGFTWLCSDVVADFVHPSPSGRVKVADQLVAFFKTDPTATPWFLKSTVTGQAPTITAATPTPDRGAAPLAVSFSASAQDADGTIAQYAWTFDDGTFSLQQNPAKTFPAPGFYHVHLTVTDNSGNTAKATRTVAVSTADAEVLDPQADAAVDADAPGTSFGGQPMLKVGGTGSAPQEVSYLRYTVAGAARAAYLHLDVLNAGNPVTVLTSSNTTWSEATVTWNNRPPVDGAALCTAMPAVGPLSLDVTGSFAGSGAVTLVLQATGTDESDYSSKERAAPASAPRLEVRY